MIDLVTRDRVKQFEFNFPTNDSFDEVVAAIYSREAKEANVFRLADIEPLESVWNGYL